MAPNARIWPDTPTHPGEMLTDELDVREATIAELAALSGIDTASLEAVLSGTAPITAEIAWALELALEGISARFWMGLQADYNLGMERLKRQTA